MILKQSIVFPGYSRLNLFVNNWIAIEIANSSVILFVALQLILGGTNEIYPGTLPEFILKVI